MTSTGRVARLSALALATGTLVAAGAGTAGAATKTNTMFTANGGGSVVDLTLNLPVALPGIPASLTQKLVSTASNARTSSLVSGPAAVSTAVLGSKDSNVPLVSQLLNRTVSSTFGGHTDAPQGDFPANSLLSGGLLNLKSLTSNPDAQGALPVASSLSSVANLTLAGGGNLQAVLDSLVNQVTANLQGVIGTTPSGQETSPVAGVTTPVVDLLGNLVSQLPVIAGSGLDQAAKDALAQVQALLNSLPTALSQKLTAATADSALLKIGLIESAQTITHEGNAVTSHATNAIEKISLLGGLITLDSLTSDAVASLGNGVAPKAKGSASIVKLNVEGLLNLEITGDLQAILGSGVLPPAVTDAVEGALNSVLDLVKSALGVALAPAEYKQSATADKATAFASPAHLVVQPAGFAKPIIDLALVPAAAEVVKAQSSTTTTVIKPGKQGSRHQFAPTGANFGLTAPIAISLMGIALYARRRRLATLEG